MSVVKRLFHCLISVVYEKAAAWMFCVDRDFNRFFLQNDQNVTADMRRRCYWLVSVFLHGKRKTEPKWTQKSNTTTLLPWTFSGSLKCFVELTLIIFMWNLQL